MQGTVSHSGHASDEDITAANHRRRIRRVRFIGVTTMLAFAAAAAVVSYNDGLFLVHLAGTTGRLAYLYPLLPDGLIVISWASMYEAGLTGQPRPGWAIAGIVLGACLTVAMNVAAGILHNGLDALIDGVVPVAFFVALEILMGVFRRGRDAAASPGVPAASTAGEPDEPDEPLTPEAALLALIATAPRRQVAELLGVPKTRVDRWAVRLPRPVQDGPDEVPAAALNGSAPDAR